MTIPVASYGPIKAKIQGDDTASVDAFARWRVSNPLSIFDAQFTYRPHTLLYEQITNGSGATVTHDTTNRAMLMTFSSTPTGGKAYMQSYQYFPYQPGNGQLVFITFNFVETMANTIKFAGYGDDTNGIFLEQSGTTVQFKIYSGTALGAQTVAKASWNLDKLDGTGPSGITLDLTKTQILVIDFQALYVGRVRVGFDIGGIIIYVHQFLNANIAATPYIQTANLPIRIGMTCTGTVSTTMLFVCSAIKSEGGRRENMGLDFNQNGSVSAGSGARTHAMSIRPKTTFNSITNRIFMQPKAVCILVTGNYPVYWELCLGQAISGTTTFNDVNTTYSGMEYNTAGTISGSPTIVIDAGYVPASNQNVGSETAEFGVHYPMTLDASGAQRALGTYTLVLTGLGGATQTYYTMHWEEIR